jgi:hypothetical protein
MPGDPNECREHAKNCRDMAEAAVSPLAKARFEDLARTWTRLANDLEHAKALVEHWGNPRIKSGCAQPSRAAIASGESTDQL